MKHKLHEPTDHHFVTVYAELVWAPKDCVCVCVQNTNSNPRSHKAKEQQANENTYCYLRNYVFDASYHSGPHMWKEQYTCV